MLRTGACMHPVTRARCFASAAGVFKGLLRLDDRPCCRCAQTPALGLLLVKRPAPLAKTGAGGVSQPFLPCSVRQLREPKQQPC